jgi:hypothetical protein
MLGSFWLGFGQVGVFVMEHAGCLARLQPPYFFKAGGLTETVFYHG